MRLIGEFQVVDEGNKQTERFQRFLAQHGIVTELRSEPNVETVWVLDEDRLAEADEFFKAFSADPTHSRFNSSARLPTDKIPGRPSPESQIIDARREVFGRPQQVLVTLGCISISVLFTLMSMSDDYMGFIKLLYFSQYTGRSFPEIAHGQAWRLITPVFLHSGFMHLGFNMLWLWQLGGQIEALQGSRFLFVFLVFFAALCDTSQYLVSGPLFVGISGVVYALLGFVWMMSRYEAAGRYSLQPQTVTFMVIWLLACTVGIIPNVANTQHIVGFVGGTAFGYLYSGGFKSDLRRRRYRKSLR